MLISPPLSRDEAPVRSHHIPPRACQTTHRHPTQVKTAAESPTDLRVIHPRLLTRRPDIQLATVALAAGGRGILLSVALWRLRLDAAQKHCGRGRAGTHRFTFFLSFFLLLEQGVIVMGHGMNTGIGYRHHETAVQCLGKRRYWHDRQDWPPHLSIVILFIIMCRTILLRILSLTNYDMPAPPDGNTRSLSYSPCARVYVEAFTGI